MLRTSRRRLAALAAVLAIGGSLALTPSAQAAPGAPAAPGRDSKGSTVARATQAQQALTAAKAILSGRGSASPDRDATIALRDLAVGLPYLKGADRRAASALLARPSTTNMTCSSEICVHYKPSEVQSMGPGVDGVPTYVSLVLATITNVRQKYIDGHYRVPESDGGAGGTPQFDVYLADTGAKQIYGYCTTDDNGVPNGDSGYDTWAFCVFDNDFRTGQFPSHTPTENLQVTTAHEYFHATQFAYDFGEDRWLLEATATWAEDEIYPDVNDNRQYLPRGPLGRPGTPLDTFENSGVYQYGTWIFFRYLSEHVDTTKQGLMPVIVREIWERADGSVPGPKDYDSARAISYVLETKGTTFKDTFARFADANRRPASTYSEGSSSAYTPALPYKQLTLSSKSPSSHQISRKQNHMTSSTVRFTPSSVLGSSRWRLRIRVDLDSKYRAAALVSVTDRSGRVTTRTIPLDSAGKGRIYAPFSAAQVRRVELTTVNASTRFDCFDGGAYSCAGTPLDDGKTYVVSGVAYKS